MDDIRWTDRPPAQSRLPHLPLQSVKPGKPITGIITCTKMRCLYTHFLGARTQPCMKLNCPGCEKKMPHRWEGYLSIWTTKPGKHIIARITEAAANAIEESVPNWNDLRGIYIELTRASTRPNSRLLAEIKVLELNQVKLPSEPDLIQHLNLIWRNAGQEQQFELSDFVATREEILQKVNGEPHA